jgi:hypothetical protein
LEPDRPIPWHWERAWHRFETRIISGGHGEYFRPANRPGLARAILDPDGENPVSCAAQADRLAECRHVVCRTIGTEARSTTIEVAAPSFGGLDGMLGILPVWRKPDGSILTVQGPDWVVPVDRLPVWRRSFPSPVTTPDAALIPVLCLAGHGPLTWPKEVQFRSAKGAGQTD